MTRESHSDRLKREARERATWLPHVIRNPNETIVIFDEIFTGRTIETTPWLRDDAVVPLCDLDRWCYDNCRGDFRVYYSHARFSLERDAVLFKLWWG